MQGDKSLAYTVNNSSLAKRGIQTSFFYYAQSANKVPAECSMSAHGVKDEGNSIACTSFLQWQTRRYERALRKACADAGEEARNVGDTCRLSSASLEVHSSDDEEEDEEIVAAEGEGSGDD